MANGKRGRPKGGPKYGGRAKGTPNKVTIEAREFARSIVDNPEYQENLRRRILAGSATELEKMLWHYAKGKPPDRVEMSGPDGSPMQRELIVRFITPEKKEQ